MTRSSFSVNYIRAPGLIWSAFSVAGRVRERRRARRKGQSLYGVMRRDHVVKTRRLRRKYTLLTAIVFNGDVSDREHPERQGDLPVASMTYDLELFTTVRSQRGRSTVEPQYLVKSIRWSALMKAERTELSLILVNVRVSWALNQCPRIRLSSRCPLCRRGHYMFVVWSGHRLPSCWTKDSESNAPPTHVERHSWGGAKRELSLEESTLN